MKIVHALGIALLVAGSQGCGKGTSTAQSTNPERPNAARKLSITEPGSQTVTQDRTDELTVSISRDHFSSPVAVEFRSLPTGVEVATQDMTIPADKTSLKVTLKASATAPAVKDHVVTVAAKAKDEKDLPEAVASFKLDVKSK